MKSKILWALVGLNLGLALLLVLPRENPAMAQRVVRPADYLLVPGEISGSAAGVVYILDTSNGLLGAMAYNDSKGVLDVMPSIDLIRMFEGGPR
jgi:hypothetical protein